MDATIFFFNSVRAWKKNSWYIEQSGDRSGTVVKLLCYKSEGRWFNPRWCHWIFHWHNPPDHTMAQGSTQPLTEMSTRRISWGWMWPVRMADNLTTSLCRCHEIWEPSLFLEPSGPLQACNRTDLSFLHRTKYCTYHGWQNGAQMDDYRYFKIYSGRGIVLLCFSWAAVTGRNCIIVSRWTFGFNTLRTGLVNGLNARSRGLTFSNMRPVYRDRRFATLQRTLFYIFNQQIYFIIWYLLDGASLI